MEYVTPSYVVAEDVGNVESLVTPGIYAIVAIIVVIALVANTAGCPYNP